MKTELEKNPKWGNVGVNYETTQPQMTLTIDREKAARLGIDINGLGATMQAMIDGSELGTVFINDASYSVRMVSTSSPVNDPGDLEVDLHQDRRRALRADVDHRLARGGADLALARPRGPAARRDRHRRR